MLEQTGKTKNLITVGAITALYCRLSRDDGEAGDSNSIVHQKEMLRSFARKQGFSNLQFYVDDGYSGTTFNRPDFQRMMEDVESGKVSTVIVKDMSRFGRDYIMVGYYTEIYFANMNIRFIAVNDNVDSATVNASENDLTPFKNVFNEWYARDTSKKIRAVFKAKGNSGKHLSNTPPFGYVKSPQDKDLWIIDEPAAEVVRKIFSLYLEGKGVRTIANILTSSKIDTPQVYFQKQGRAIHKSSEFPEIWSYQTVQHMLARQAYAGRTVNFQTRMKSFKSKKQVFLPKEEWKVFEGTQEPIIDPPVFDTVQKMLEHKRAYTKFNEINLFAGMLYCADCGKTMTIQRIAKNRSMDSYSCSTYRKKKKGLCTGHRILAKNLEQIVLRDIQKVCTYVSNYEQDFVEEYMQCSEKEMRKAEATARNELLKAEKRCEEISVVIRKLYEDNVLGRISDERFDSMEKAYEDEENQLKRRIALLKNSLAQSNLVNNNLAKFIKTVKNYTTIETLTTEILHSMVERIIIGETKRKNGIKTQEVKIIYKLVGAVNIQSGSET